MFSKNVFCSIDINMLNLYLLVEMSSLYNYFITNNQIVILLITDVLLLCTV